MTTSSLACAVGAALALALSLSACGAEAAPDPATDPASDPPGTALHDHPTGAGDVVVRIDAAGGLVPLQVAFGNQPELLVTGDGRAFLSRDVDVVSGPVVAVEVADLDDQEVQDLLALAEDAGLLGPPPGYDLGGPAVTDAATTTVTVSADGRTRTHRAYALGVDDGTPERAALVAFIEDATAVVEAADPEPYTRELRLRADPVDARGGRDPVAWPVPDVDLAGLGECTLVDGQDATAVADVLGGADLATTYRQGTGLYIVSAATVLPDEADPCRDGGLS